MGMIYKRGKTFWLKYYRNGKPYYESSKSKKETDAKRLLKRREGEISQGKLPGVYFDRVTFEELAEDLLTDYGFNKRKSIERAQMSINHLKGYFEGYRVPQITTPKIQSYIQERMEWNCKECGERFDAQDECPTCGSDILKRGAAHGTINRELSALKRMLNLGARQTPPKVDRVAYIPMLHEDNVRQGFFERDEYLALLKALPAHLRPIVTFGYNTGWRKSEILGLTWDRVDLKEGTVRLEASETKNKEARTIYMEPELAKLLRIQWLRRHKNCNNVFHNKGRPIKDFRGAWKSACAEVDIEGKLFHDLRRTGVRNMVRSGIREQVAKKISGHKTREVFERYNIISSDDLKQAADRLGEYREMVTKKLHLKK